MKTLVASLSCLLLGMTMLAQNPATIRLNLEKGKLYSVRTISHQKIQQTVSGQAIAVDVQADRFVSYRVLQKVNDIMTVELSFDTIASIVNAPMMKKETNSAKPGKEPVEKILNKLSTTKIQAKISTSGKFIGFVNYNVFKDNVLLVLDSIPASKKDEATQQANMLIKESAVRSMIEPLFNYLPETAVKTGDKWDNNYMVTSNDIASIVQTTTILNGTENGTASFAGSSQLESMPSTDPNAQMVQELKGTTTFNGVIDLTTGLTVKRTEKGHIDGSISVKNAGQDMKIPMVIDSETETSMSH